VGPFGARAWCIARTQKRQRLRGLQNQGTPLPGGGERYNKECCIYAALNCFSWIRQVCWDIDKMYGHITNPMTPTAGRFRFVLAPKFVSAITFVGTRVRIAPYRFATSSWLSYRNAGKSSWRRTASKRQVGICRLDRRDQYCKL
jgi:hypothetical protein